MTGSASSFQGAASQSQPALSGRPIQGMLGAVPVRGGIASPQRATTRARAATAAASAGANLTYHGGSVLRTNRAYAIYWGSTPSTYRSLINGFFQNVASDSGQASNAYATATQYYDVSGYIAYSASYGGSYVDTSTAIPDHCSSQYAPSSITVTGCVTDADIRAEVSRAAAAAHWPTGGGNVFFVFTPRNVGSCYDTFSGACAYTTYCAYHSNFYDSHAADVLYANHPYTDTAGVGAAGVCDSGEHPNNDWADATINVLSHEHNEAITDPNGDAWYDADGNENGDKCAWSFGAPLGATSFGAYNQVIGSGKYYLQQEWSNASRGCALTFGSIPPVVATVADFAPHKGSVGDTVTITGTGFVGVTAVRFNGLSAAFEVVSTTSITATVPVGTTNGLISVSTAGGTATSLGNFKVQAPPPPTPPAITSLSPGKGPIGASVTITGSGFTGVSTVRFNGTTAVFTVSSATSIVATVPVGSSTGPVSVTTSNGIATSAGNFKVQAPPPPAPPTITSLSPGKGPIGASVTITGTGFTGVSAVKFNGIAAVFTVVSSTSITTTVPVGTTTGPVTVTASNGTATSPGSYRVR